MGCDIHAFIEEKVGNSDRYECIAQLFLERNYTLFALLADVRNNCNHEKLLIPISEPKGLPKDLSWRVRDAYQKWEDDTHSCTYLSLAEIGKTYLRAWTDDTVDNYTKNQLLILEHTMSRMNNPRLILWFDN